MYSNFVVNVVNFIHHLPEKHFHLDLKVTKERVSDIIATVIYTGNYVMNLMIFGNYYGLLVIIISIEKGSN